MTDIIYRGRAYSLHGKHQVWYEPCKVVKRTKKFVIVESGDFPDSPLYRGGMFYVNAEQLHNKGKAYHSRHGEYFYVQKPEVGALFPSKEILATPDWVTLEAKAMGWDITIPPHQWNEWQRDCWMFAHFIKKPLRYVVDKWKAGRMSEIRQEWHDYCAERANQIIENCKDLD